MAGDSIDKPSTDKQSESTTMVKQKPSPTKLGTRLRALPSIKFPDKLYVIQSEDLRGYQRLNKKYMNLFNQAYDDYSSYKKRQLKNFKA